ncbi:MAG: enoyl-CoA hydratase [Acidobacteria bacterium]|nr:enoyl-CoA hydratase [Acidobacteriota bacterium]NIM62688.1 enoyl-CoA hydratase [Acidobacteriota bacterium]NIQ29381.1 enoyl-CoA hydratase [Acidobacteriota bacterium]NIQ83980.1 enoyl-CoA hydratase [Acidobacteriota bacterium]NIT10089.1 enoyl-CoA hydratase [Acidobacteriota bacterium]
MTLDSPPVNALGRQLVADLEEALKNLKDDPQVRCLVLRSGGKHFCAGADLKERRTMSAEEVEAFVPRLAGVCHGVAALPFPTIAAVRGAAAGGGCELALGCDLRILAEDARIGLRETALAIIPGAGGTQRLPRLVGMATAKRWIFGAEMHAAAAALADGVADRVVPTAELDAAAQAWAKTIASNGPVALRLAKKAIEEGADLPMPEALEREWECYQGVLGTADRVEALKAFAEKRPPKFEGR